MKNSRLVSFSAVIGFSFFISLVLLFLTPRYAFGLILIFFLAYFFAFRPRIGLFFILGILSLRGLVTGETLGTGIYLLDMGGIINIAINIFGLSYIIIHRKNILSNNVVKAYGIFLCVAFLSCFYSGDAISSFRYFVRLLTPLSVFIILTFEIKSLEDISKVSIFLLLIAVIPLIFGLLEASHNLASYHRISGIFGHPNPFSFYLLILFPIVFSGLIIEKTMWKKFVFGLTILLVTVSMVFTYCRISWLAFFVSALLIPLFLKKKGIIIPVLICVAILLLVNSLKLDERIGDVTRFMQKGDIFDTNNSIGWRLKAWELTFREFLKSPFWGHGLRAHYGLIKSLFGWETSVHNSYLEILYDLGVMGFLAFMLFIGVLAKNLFLDFKKYAVGGSLDSNTVRRRYTAIFASVLISFLIIMISDNILEYYDVGSIYWAFFAIGSKLPFLQDNINL